MSEWSPRVRRVDQGDKGRLVFVNSLIREKRYDEAENELEEILGSDAGALAATMTMGRLQMTQRRFDRAQQYFHRAHEIEPMQAWPVLLEGICHVMLNDTDNAEHCFKQTIALDPKLPGAYLGLAQVSNKKKDPQQAIEFLEESLRLDPQSTPARLMLAGMHIKTGDGKASVSELSNVLSKNPNNRAAAFALAATYAKQEDFSEAQSILDDIVRSRPNDVAALSLLSRVQMRQGDYAGAERTIRKLSAHRKRSGAASTLMLVEALLHQKKTAEARSLLESVPKRAHLRAPLNKAYGDLYYAEKNYGEAIECYRAVLLGSNKGREAAEKIEKEMAEGESQTPSKALADRYRKAVTETGKAARDQLAERDWKAMFERFQPTLMEMLNNRRRNVAGTAS